MKNIKREKGITLIALVITIIVLLILAGVAISMLSGENGILTRASEASEETKKAEEKENIILIDMEVEIDFSMQNTTYKFRNGYLTNINVVEEESETVASVEKKLPEEYTICNIDGGDIIQKETTNVGTGMILKKNNKIMGRIIVFGDIDGNGKIELADGTLLRYLCEDSSKYEEYQIMSSDIIHDGMISKKNSDKLLNMVSNIAKMDIEQNVYAKNIEELKVMSELKYQKNIIENELPKEFRNSYNIYYDKEEECFMLKLDNSQEVTAIEILSKLGEGYEESYIRVNGENGKKNISIEETPTAIDVVKNGDKMTIYYDDINIQIYILIM